jgi:hypothetical protein
MDDQDFDPRDAEPYEPTDEEIAQMQASSEEERTAVELMILRECSSQWQKVAKIVGDLLKEFEQNYPHLPFAYLQATMEELASLEKVEIVGDVWRMRYSEIRLVPPSNVASKA